MKSKQQMKEFTKILQKQMEDASSSEQFERAIEIRDTLQRLGSIDLQISYTNIIQHTKFQKRLS